MDNACDRLRRMLDDASDVGLLFGRERGEHRPAGDVLALPRRASLRAAEGEHGHVQLDDLLRVVVRGDDGVLNLEPGQRHDDRGDDDP